MPLITPRVKGLILYLLLLPCAFPLMAGEHTGNAKPLGMVFFYSSDCRGCKRASEAVDKALAEFGDRVTLEKVNTIDAEKGMDNVKRLWRMLDAHGVTETPSLAIFVGSSVLCGEEEIDSRIRDTIIAELGKDGETTVAATTDRMSLWSISAAALADGFNPCAFATVILLVSMMSTLGKSRRDVLAVGIAFTLAVYISYFLIGLFVYEVVGVFKSSPSLGIVSDGIYYLAIILCFVCGLLSFYDAYVTFAGAGQEKIVLSLPDSLKNRIRKTMRAGITSRNLALGAFFAGILVSFFESACTGQVYFPVIVALVRDSHQALKGICLLLWYNLIFILPLIAVFSAAMLGVSDRIMAKNSRMLLPLTKLALGIVFIGLAVMMVV